ncbi:hypothetical protein FRC11_000366, partial [Ceratobasidium sp. 423]
TLKPTVLNLHATKSTLDSTTSPPKILNPASMSPGTAVRALWSGMFSIELNMMVMRRNIANPMTPMQKMHHSDGSKSKTLQPKPAPPNPITVTREKFALLHSMVGLMSSMPSLTHPPPDRPTVSLNSQPKRQESPNTPTNTKHSTTKASSTACRRSSASMSVGATPKQLSIGSGSPQQNKCLRWDLCDARLRYICIHYDEVIKIFTFYLFQIVMLPPTPFQVGGSWSQEVVGGSQSTRSCKRTAQVTTDLSKGSSTHQCMEPLVDDDTVTEPETNNEPTVGPEPPQCGKQALSPSREPTATTILDSQPSNASSHPLRGSVTRSHPHSQGISLSPSGDQPSAQAPPPSEDEPPLKKTKRPQVLAPLCGPVHTRLHAELLTRHAIDTVNDISQALSHANNQTDEVQSDLDEVPKTQSSSNLHTYRSCHSHLPSEPGATAAQSTGATNPADGPDKPSNLLTPSQLIQREHAWAVTAKACKGMSKVPPCPCPMLAAASQPPASHPQSRLPP